MAGKDKKLLTLELDLETLAEFSAARKVFGARSNASLLHQQVVQKIREAKQLVSKEEFEEIKEVERLETIKRSNAKSLERENSIAKKQTKNRVEVKNSKSIPVMSQAAGENDHKKK